MTQKDPQQVPTTTRELRKFGLLVGGVFLLLGGLCLWRHKPAGPWFLTPGVLLVLLGLIAPRALRTVYGAWMGLASIMGLIVSTVILSIFYYLVITPIAVMGRLFGKDFLSQKRDPGVKSYWLPRDRSAARKPADYEQQY